MDNQLFLGAGLGLALFAAAFFLFVKPSGAKAVTVPVGVPEDLLALHTATWRKFELIQKTELSPNTAS